MNITNENSFFDERNLKNGQSLLDSYYNELLKLLKISKSRVGLEYVITCGNLSMACFNDETIEDDLKKHNFKLQYLFGRNNIDGFKKIKKEAKQKIINGSLYLILLFNENHKVSRVALISKDDTIENVKKYAKDRLDEVFVSLEKEMAKMGIL